MSADLPPSWTVARIAALLAPNTNGKPFQQGWSPQCESIPARTSEWGVLKTTAIQEGLFLEAENKRLPLTLTPRPHLEVKRGDILMTCAGPRSRCGITCLVRETREKLMISGKMYRFRPNADLVLPEYLESFLHSMDAAHAIDRMKTGISDSGLNLTHGRFAELLVPVPPVGEQRRIVAKIAELFSEVDSGVGSLQSAQAQINAYNHAVLRQAFQGQLTSRWRAREHCSGEWARCFLEEIRLARARQSSRTVQPSAELTIEELNQLPTLPKEWVYARLSDIAGIGSGMSVSKSRSLDDPIEVPYLRVANVQRGYLDLKRIATMRVERDQLPALRLRKWDVLFNEGGDRDKLGRGWIWESQIDPCITQNHVFRASPYVPGEVHAKFISHWGNTFGQKYFIAEGRQTTNLASINRAVLSKFPVPLPSLEEQAAILNLLDAQLSVARRLDHEVATALEMAGRLKESILRRAFVGRLVSQSGKDEPPAIILERVRSEAAEKLPGRGRHKKATRAA